MSNFLETKSLWNVPFWTLRMATAVLKSTKIHLKSTPHSFIFSWKRLNMLTWSDLFAFIYVDLVDRWFRCSTPTPFHIFGNVKDLGVPAQNIQLYIIVFISLMQCISACAGQTAHFETTRTLYKFKTLQKWNETNHAVSHTFSHHGHAHLCLTSNFWDICTNLLGGSTSSWSIYGNFTTPLVATLEYHKWNGTQHWTKTCTK